MDAERLRAHLLTLPHVVETMQWGANLVFWVGDKAIGGKMFALIDLDEAKLGGPANAARKTHPILSYAAGPARYSELLEVDGLIPAPYMARIHWVAAEGWDVFSAAEWQRELNAAHALTLAKLAPRTRKVLALPAAEQRSVLAERRKELAGRKLPARSSRSSTKGAGS
jgi:predicted DNA-binding protein (MmcQ/YjbR family)